MSITSGFFNSINGDRKYNAEQMSSLFDGIINDGVFANIGSAFKVTAIGVNDISIAEGRAWFNSTWINNDYPVVLTASASDVLYNRYDAVVIEVNRNDSVRSCELKIITGAPASNPLYPILTDNANVHQHALAFIYRPANSTTITQSNIINCIGSSYCPYITGILQVQDISKNVAQWEAEWDEWYAAKTREVNNESSEWIAAKQSEITTWFNEMRDILDEDTAVSLANKMIEIEMKLDNTNLDNVVMKTGSTLTGDLNFQPTEGGGRSKVGRDETVENHFGLLLEDTNSAGRSRAVRICGGLDILEYLVQGVPYKIYTSYNPPTAKDVGALPSTGGTLTGDLTVDNGAAYGLSKIRTIDGVKYSTDVGVGNDPARGTSASMRIRNAAGTVIGRIDAWSNGSFTFSKDGVNFVDLLHGGDSSAAIACGSYWGTGTAGYSNPNVLTFGFKPKAIFVFYYYVDSNTDNSNSAPRLGYINVGALNDQDYKQGAFTANISYSDTVHARGSYQSAYGKVSPDGKTVQWYSSNVSPYHQMNISGTRYDYVAIGL